MNQFFSVFFFFKTHFLYFRYQSDQVVTNFKMLKKYPIVFQLILPYYIINTATM